MTNDAGVIEELNAYNPLIPEPNQLCATLFEEGYAENLTRADITAAVHYVQFEFNANQVKEFAAGNVRVTSDHPAYIESVELPSFIVTELLTDLRD